MNKKININLPLIVLVGIIFFSSFLPSKASAAEQVLKGFDPNKIIEDSVFSNSKVFGGSDGIQKFLESKNSPLANTSADFLSKLKEPSSSEAKSGLDDPHPNLERLRTAAELIWDASQASGLNPQVILVTLNKEQSLITGHQNSTPEKFQRALDFSMGFGCPDSQPCGEIYRGFYSQLFGGYDTENNRYLGAAHSLMKSFNTPGGRGPVFNGSVAKVGDTITLPNTMGSFDGIASEQSVRIGNLATAALYRYTPHVFNGNYNFWRFFNMWFRYPNGTLIKEKGRSAKLYMIQDGSKYQVLPFVASARNLQITSALTVNKKELAGYPGSDYLGMPDNTLVKIGEQLYIFMNNKKSVASTYVIEQRGLNASSAITLTDKEAKYFKDGPPLALKEGSIVRGQSDPSVYLVQNGLLKLFTPLTLSQYKASSKVQTVPDSEISNMLKRGLVPPLEGTLIKLPNDPSVFVIEQGERRPVSAEMFKLRGYKNSDVATVTQAEYDTFPQGTQPTPPNNTYFTNEKTGEFWVYMDGVKRRIFNFVATQKKMTPDVKYPDGYVNALKTGVPIAPKEGTIIKGDKSATVYVVSGATLRPLTAAAFKARKITTKQISIQPQAEVDVYAKGATLTK